MREPNTIAINMWLGCHHNDFEPCHLSRPTMVLQATMVNFNGLTLPLFVCSQAALFAGP